MKKDIKKLEIKKLFKEFSFLKIDEEYKSEIQALYGPEFAEAIRKIFKEKQNPGASDINLTSDSAHYPKEQKMIGVENIINSSTEINIEIYTGKTEKRTGASNIAQKKDNVVDEDAKKLYRKIATKTHPDKVSSKYLNELYIKAQSAYEQNDIFTLYLICNDLGIDYELSVNKLSEFKARIKVLRASNSITEQTYLWTWIHEENEDIKMNILHHFIAQTQKINF